MLPVVKGADAARWQILVYALVLAPLGLSPVATGLGGWLYAVVAAAAGGLFVLLAVRVHASRAGDRLGETAAADAPDLYEVKAGDRAARDLFAFSILYLFLLFAALLVEHGLGAYAPVVLPGAAFGAAS
jgi:protoheme IX farnesyltransferase